MFRKFITWFKDFIEPKCDVCGDKYVDLYSDGWGLLLCKKCDDKDIEAEIRFRKKQRASYLKRINK